MTTNELKEKITGFLGSNLPIQIFPVKENDEDDESPVIDYEILVYSPRKERLWQTTWDEFVEEELNDENRRIFFETVAEYYDNLALMFRRVANEQNFFIYYPDEGMID